MKFGQTIELTAVSGRKQRRWLGLFLILMMPLMSAPAKGVPTPPIAVKISVHDDAGVPWGTIRASENEASRVFREAGIELDWQNCHASPDMSRGTEEWEACAEAGFPEHLHVRVVKTFAGLSPQTMGISFLSEDGSGCQADVSYDGIRVLQSRSSARLVTVLGHIMAHEIGHLLLGPKSHAQEGIMRAVWGHDELVRASRGALLFSVEQSQQMRERLVTWIGDAYSWPKPLMCLPPTSLTTTSCEGIF